MVMTNFLKKRKTVRDFTNENVSPGNLELIREELARIEAEDANIHFVLHENGDTIADALDGKAGYSGVMIRAPHYISLAVNDESDRELLYTGYYLERANGFIVNLDLGTCWITVDEVDAQTMNNTFGNGGENIKFLIGFGHPEGQLVFDEKKASPRKTLKEMVYMDSFNTPADLETLEQYGLLDIFSSVRFAPSHMNTQPWKFLIKDSDVYLYLINQQNQKRSLVDLGIMMYYYEAMQKEMNNTVGWEIVEDKTPEGDLIPVAKTSL